MTLRLLYLIFCQLLGWLVLLARRVGCANPAKACELAVRIKWGAVLWRLR